MGRAVIDRAGRPVDSDPPAEITDDAATQRRALLAEAERSARRSSRARDPVFREAAIKRALFDMQRAIKRAAPTTKKS